MQVCTWNLKHIFTATPMDLIHKLLNIFLPPFALLLCLCSLPFLLTFKLLSFLKVCDSSENVSGKVVLITGASSGIGEYVAYEYAKRKARLSLVARREERLLNVAEEARQLGSPDILVICADVSKMEDCKRFVGETVSHFGQLDHLVSNAGVVHTALFEEIPTDELSKASSIMGINFWGSVYAAHFGIQHLRKSKGKLVVISSSAAWLCGPRLALYSASKAAQLTFFEILRAELGSDVGITIVTPGLVRSEITTGQFMTEMRLKNVMPLESTEGCAKAIVTGVCRGDEFLTEPWWYTVLFWMKLFCPQVMQWSSRNYFVE